MDKEGTPTLRFDPIQHKEGATLKVYGCIDGSCTQLDKENWDRENRPQAVRIRDMMNKIQDKDYHKMTCERFGGNLVGDKCVVKKPKSKSARATTKKKKK